MLVVGDVMLDRYLSGSFTRISPEAPTPIFDENEGVDARLGGAANVAHNIASLSAKVALVGRMGLDPEGSELLQVAKTVMRIAPLYETGIGTIVKTRQFDEEHGVQVGRSDREGRGKWLIPLSQESKHRVVQYFTESASGVDALVLSDYNKGVFKSGFAERLIASAKEKSVKVVAGPKPANILGFSYADVMCLNRKEAIEAVKPHTKEQISVMASYLREIYHIPSLVITCGKDGVFIQDSAVSMLIPAKKQEVFDVTGAGDTVLAAIALSLTAGATLVEAAHIANAAAGLAIRRVGTVAVSLEELLQAL